MRCALCQHADIPAVIEREGVPLCAPHDAVIRPFAALALRERIKEKPARDPRALYCPHCGEETKQVEVSDPVLAELGSLLQPAGAVIYVAFTCPKCRTIISCSVVSAKAPGGGRVG